jgi:hypothetical protein
MNNWKFKEEIILLWRVRVLEELWLLEEKKKFMEEIKK